MIDFKELDKRLIRLYRAGHSLDFMAKVYYRNVNRDRNNYYVPSGFYISKKNVSMAQARHYVVSLIYNNILQKSRE